MGSNVKVQKMKLCILQVVNQNISTLLKYFFWKFNF